MANTKNEQKYKNQFYTNKNLNVSPVLYFLEKHSTNDYY